jgi:putative flippase GtrA
MPAIDRIRRHDFWLQKQSVRYLLATVFSATVSFCLPVVLHEIAKMTEETSVAISFSVVFLVNFITARVFVFRSNVAPMFQLVKFAASSVFFRFVEYLAFLAALRFLGLHYLVALLLVLTISSIAKFFFQRAYVFRV